MGKKSKKHAARRSVKQADVDHSDVVDKEEEETGEDFEAIVQLVIKAVKASGAAVTSRAMEGIVDQIWDNKGDISYGAVQSVLRESGVVDSVGQANKLWRQMELEIVAHNEGATREIAQQGHEQEAEQVLVTQTARTKQEKTASEKGGKGGKTEAPGTTKAHKGGAKARGQKASETLGLALSSIPRKAKPRSDFDIDEILWSDARKIAENEVTAQFELSASLEDYYTTMCTMGKSLLAAELQRRTQRLYDYKARKQFQRELN
jgi:hypothetical protein